MRFLKDQRGQYTYFRTFSPLQRRAIKALQSTYSLWSHYVTVERSNVKYRPMVPLKRRPKNREKSAIQSRIQRKKFEIQFLT